MPICPSRLLNEQPNEEFFINWWQNICHEFIEIREPVVDGEPPIGEALGIEQHDDR
jgi:hypothetical protein